MTQIGRALSGQYVDLFDYAAKPLEVRWRGTYFPGSAHVMFYPAGSSGCTLH